MPAICLDIDNVIARTDEVMREVIRIHSKDGVDLNYEDIVCFDYWMCRDGQGRKIERNEWGNIHGEFTSNHLPHILPFENISDHIGRLSQKFDVYFATSRLEHGKDKTIAWLQEHRVPYEKASLFFVKHGEKHLINRKFDVVIEDDREQAYAFHCKGTSAFLLAHPWNVVGSHSPLQRIQGWEKLIEEILSVNVKTKI